MSTRTKLVKVVAVLTVLVIALMAVSEGADARRRRCRRRPRGCRPRPVLPVPQPPAPDNLLVVSGGGFAILDEGRHSNRVPVDLGGRRVVDVDVTVRGLSHERLEDIDMLLRGPEGAPTALMVDAGTGASATGLELTFDDEATSALPPSGRIARGSYTPSSYGFIGAVSPESASLSDLDGTTQDGDWSLLLNDDEAGAVGSLSGWTLQLELEPVPVAPLPPSASGGETIVFESTDVPVSIVDGDVVATTVNVPDLGGRTITDVNVVFYGLTHTAVDDLDIKLENPSQIREVVLMSDVGSGPVDDVTFKLDDEADFELPDTGPLVNRRIYRPRNVGTSDAFGSPDVLSEFDGTEPSGQWVMTILDDAAGDSGPLREWALELTVS